MSKYSARMTATETARLLLPPDAVDEMTQEEAAYYSSIDEAAENRSDKVFENGHPYHALYLIYKLTSIAKKHLRIYTGRLGQHWEQFEPLFRNKVLIARIDSALKAGVEVSILVEDQSVDLKTHPIAALEHHKKFSLHHLHSADREALERANYNRHFAVADTEAYRLEFFDNEDSVTADASFCGAELARTLASVFDGLRPMDNQAKI